MDLSILPSKSTLLHFLSSYSFIFCVHIAQTLTHFPTEIWESSYLFNFCHIHYNKKTSWDFPGGPMVRNLPASAGDTGSIPGQGGHTYHEAALTMYHNYWSPHSRAWVLQQEKTLLWEACAPQLKSSPCLLELEKALTQQWRPSTARGKKISLSYWFYHLNYI